MVGSIITSLAEPINSKFTGDAKLQLGCKKDGSNIKKKRGG